MKKFLILVGLVCIAGIVNGDDVKSVIEKVQIGTDAGKALTDVMVTANKTLTFISQFATKICPFLGAIFH